MFSLRQAPNFSSAFQLQFVGVFAAATLAFVLFGRVLLVDRSGTVVGLATTGLPGAARDAWRGVAVAREGEDLTAYGVIDAGRLCRLGGPRPISSP